MARAHGGEASRRVMKIEVVLVGGVCSKRDSVDIASNGCCGKLGGLRRVEARRCDVK